MKKLTPLLFFFVFALAHANISEKNTEIIQSFRNYFEVEQLDIQTPEVLNIKLPVSTDIPHFGVYNKTSDRFEPYFYVETSDVVWGDEPIQVLTTQGNPEGINDKSFDTYVDFELNENSAGYTQISYLFQNEIRSNSIDLSLAQYVSLPNSVTVKALVDGSQKTLLSNSRPTTRKITFPETISREWKIEFTYSQPLRINELQINNLNIKKNSPQLTFLAQPNTEYAVYTNPDTILRQETSERPNLNVDIDGNIESVSIDTFLENSIFRPSDKDRDSISDMNDNCVNTPNTDQEDINNNGRGDVCDDFDKDGILNNKDNCINEPNRDQADIDGDGIGDICDGEESRLTEQHPWIVWGGILLAAVIFLGLLASTVRKIRLREIENTQK